MSQGDCVKRFLHEADMLFELDVLEEVKYGGPVVSMLVAKNRKWIHVNKDELPGLLQGKTPKELMDELVAAAR